MLTKSHDREIISLVSTLKQNRKSEMPAPLNHFLDCQIVTLKNTGLPYHQNADELGLKAKSTAQSVYKRYIRNKSYLPKQSTGRPLKLSAKTENKLVRDVLKDPKRSLEKNRVKYHSFSTKESLSRTTVRRILKKHDVFSRIAPEKITIKNNFANFRKKMVRTNDEKSAGFWYSVVVTDETRVKLTSDGIVPVFRRKNTRCHEQNVRNESTDRRSIIYWGAIRSDGQKMLVKCPNTLNRISYLDILNRYNEKMHFPGLVF